MRALGLLVLGQLMAGLPAWAQSADCRAEAAQPGIPLQLDLSSLPGAAGKGASSKVASSKVASSTGATSTGPTGTALVMVPAGPSPACANKPPHLPEDVLHGDPGDALSGDPPPARK